jgi:hypothetical protein
MPPKEDVRRIKCSALLAQAKKLIGAASNAAHEGHWNELQTKILQTFVLMDLCWKISANRDGERDEISALMNIEALSDRFRERIAQSVKPEEWKTVIDSNGVAVAKRV